MGALALPFIVLYLLRRGLRDRAYFKGLRERFGSLPEKPTVPGGVWLHAVSVGEVMVAAQWARAWKRERPASPIYVSTTTLAGRRVADQRFAGLAEMVFFAPVDYRFAVRRLLRRLRPSAVIVFETEIWPNLYREAKRAGCALAVVNGRISDHAWPKYRRLSWFFRAALQWPDRILAQDETAAARYRALGAAHVETGGNLKYDFDPHTLHPPRFVEQIAAGRTVWIAASTMPPAFEGDIDEDHAVLDAFAQLSGVLLILAPRKPERFDAAASLLERRGLRFVRRSEGRAIADPQVLLLDSVGELSGTFSLADVVFMGGTLAARGGHNILEPAAFGKAVITGPHMQNFAGIEREFRAAGASVAIASPAELAGAVRRLLEEEGERERIGDRARALANARRGATRRAVDTLLSLPALPRHAPYPWLRPLAWLWRAGLEAHRRLARPRTMQTAVISVGGLSMGGAGKTPFVLWLTAKLCDAGARPAILTRGYRRASSESLVLAPGAAASRELTGDEAAIYARRAHAALGIGGDRYAAARRIEAEHSPSHFILDDGFQHWRLARDCDIVLVDALDPFAGGIFPAGRAREGFSALRRADAVVLTRAYHPHPALTEAIAQSTRAPLFRSRPVATGWRTLTGAPFEGSFENAVAFCGLANPAAFWLTLEELGIRPSERHAFPDHHRYSAAEIQRLNAPLLLTTEKDAMNLPEGCGARVVYLEISIEIDNWPALLELILSKSRSHRFSASPPA